MYYFDNYWPPMSFYPMPMPFPAPPALLPIPSPSREAPHPNLTLLENRDFDSSQKAGEIQKEKEQSQEFKKLTRFIKEEHSDSQYCQEKRNYFKKHNKPIKKFSCSADPCPRLYSSQTALRSHERNVHGIWYRVKKQKSSASEPN